MAVGKTRRRTRECRVSGPPCKDKGLELTRRINVLAANHQPREASQIHLRPRARRPAHPQQPPRPDEPAERSDEGPHLGEGDGAVDSPDLSARERAASGGGRHVVVVVLSRHDTI